MEGCGEGVSGMCYVRYVLGVVMVTVRIRWV